MSRPHSRYFRNLLAGKCPPAFAALFLFVLVLPLLKAILFPAEKYSLQDQGGNAAAAARERGSRHPGFLADWNDYVNTHFGGRDIVIHWSNWLQVKLLNVSPVETLMLGRDGWLFLAGPHPEMDFFRNDKPFSAEEMERWRRVLTQRYIWLERQGIRFIYVLAPNKSSIYPEKVPARIHRAATRLDQLIEYLRRRPLPAGFLLVDLRKTLRAAKSRYPVYGRIDSHWNSFGALLAANKILGVLARSYPLHPHGPGDFIVSLGPGAGPRGDLAAMLSLADVLTDPQTVTVAPRSPARAIAAEPAHWLNKNLEREVTICPGAELPEALMFRDSFGNALTKILSEHFRKITYVRDMGLRFHPRIVREVRPKIVIQEMCERFLQVLPPVNPPELAAIDTDR